MWYAATTFSCTETPHLLNNSHSICPIGRQCQAQWQTPEQKRFGTVTDPQEELQPEGGVRPSLRAVPAYPSVTCSAFPSALYIDVLWFCPPARESKNSSPLIFLRSSSTLGRPIKFQTAVRRRQRWQDGKIYWYPCSFTCLSHMSCRDVVYVDNIINHDGFPQAAHCKSHFIKLIVLALKSNWWALFIVKYSTNACHAVCWGKVCMVLLWVIVSVIFKKKKKSFDFLH